MLHYMMSPFLFSYVRFVYGYLFKGAGNSKETGAFRALSHGFQHWSSGQIERIQVNVKHPNFYHIFNPL